MLCVLLLSASNFAVVAGCRAASGKKAECTNRCARDIASHNTDLNGTYRRPRRVKIKLRETRRESITRTRTQLGFRQKFPEFSKSKAPALILVAARWAVHRWNQGRAGFNKNLFPCACYPPAFILRGT